MEGLVGKKVGMTRIFKKNGLVIPVSVISIDDHYIVQVKNLINCAYNIVQVTTGIQKKHRIHKSRIGIFLKSKVPFGKGLWEFLIKKNTNVSVGSIVNISIFNKIKKVNVLGISKGKGFSGTVKRWNFKTQDASHGNSLSHRAPGSIGQNQSPGRVFKGKKMPGQMGNKKVTVRNLSIIQINLNKKFLLLKGSVPGANGNNVIIKSVIDYSQ